MSSLSEKFNSTDLSRFLNGGSGRLFRIFAGLVFLVVGYIFNDNIFGILSMIWSFFPFTAGLFDICYISAVLGGPISGKKIRSSQE